MELAYYCVARNKPVLKYRVGFSVSSFSYVKKMRKVYKIWIEQQDWLETRYDNEAKDFSSKSTIMESLQYGTFLSNICRISQPMSVNLVLKLNKHVDYILVCISRNLLTIYYKYCNLIGYRTPKR